MIRSTVKYRDANLDLLRAIAILAVLFYHISGMWPTEHGVIQYFSGLGKYGVTLFFVLSGWLIGGIFWRQHKLTGRVNWGSFWIRRWLRTMPPYLAGMALGYTAVYLARAEEFDVQFLYFGQNYQPKLPFYSISWSLCVEEHFYLALPITGSLFLSISARYGARLLLWCVPLLPMLFRLIDPYVEATTPVFGYSHTATHLVFEGLALGVAGAYTSTYSPDAWMKIQKYCRYVSVPAIVIFLSIVWWDKEMVFYFGQSVVALCCFVWLAAVEGSNCLPFARSKVVFVIAITSYSVYLTHSLSIHVARRIAIPRGTFASELIALGIWIVVISIVGGVFYFVFECSSIVLRDFISKKFDKWVQPGSTGLPGNTSSAEVPTPASPIDLRES